MVELRSSDMSNETVCDKCSIKGSFYTIKVNAIAGEDVYHHNYLRLVIEDGTVVAYNDVLHDGTFECIASEEPRHNDRNIAVKYKGEHIIAYIYIHSENFINNISKFRL